jgi:hypothetical protein
VLRRRAGDGLQSAYRRQEAGGMVEYLAAMAQIEKLFDSITGDYPIASFLFWRVDETNKEEWTTFEFIRQFNEETPHNPEANQKGITRDI